MIPLKKKIVLGTVQLGLPYGINNSQGKPNIREAFRILDLAKEHQVQLLDTADAYGDSLTTIGAYLQQDKSSPFKIISKFIADDIPVQTKLENSLKILNVTELYAYLFHRFSDYNSRHFQTELIRLREQRKVQRLGVSVYSIDELSDAINDNELDLIQLSLNPLDYSPEKKRLLKQARAAGKEIHVRSIFLQGLFFKSPEQLTGNLTGLYQPLCDFHQILKDHNLTVRQACINYALHQKEVDYVLIGVETVPQLQENFDAIQNRFDEKIMEQLEAIMVPDPLLLNPSTWRP